MTATKTQRTCETGQEPRRHHHIVHTRTKALFTYRTRALPGSNCGLARCCTQYKVRTGKGVLFFYLGIESRVWMRVYGIMVLWEETSC